MLKEILIIGAAIGLIILLPKIFAADETREVTKISDVLMAPSRASKGAYGGSYYGGSWGGL